jgi:hypothetical protein
VAVVCGSTTLHFYFPVWCYKVEVSRLVLLACLGSDLVTALIGLWLTQVSVRSMLGRRCISGL